MAATAPEVKRQSTGNKVATPRIGPSSQGPAEIDGTALAKAIGARIKLTTASPSTTIEGTIFTTDRVTNIIAIASTRSSAGSPALANSGSPPTDYHIIPISRIQSFTIVSLAPGPSTDFTAATPSIGKIDIKTLKAREDAAVRKLKEAEARKGKVVGSEGHAIFDALSRTLPARWHNTDIIINDTILIRPPYTPASCVAPSTTPASSLDRIKRVLEVARQRLLDDGTMAENLPASHHIGDADARADAVSRADPMLRGTTSSRVVAEGGDTTQRKGG